MATPNLDAADVRILRALQEDGRLTNVELADKVGLSPSPCLRRVKRLEAEGLINGYAALLDQKRLGLGVTVYVEISIERHAETTAAFRHAVAQLDEIVACYQMAGRCDFLLKVVVPDLDAYAAFMSNKLLKLPAIKDVSSSFVLDAVKQSNAVTLDHLLAR